MQHAEPTHIRDLQRKREPSQATPTDLKAVAARDLASVLNATQAHVFALYLKTRNVRWHMSDAHLRAYHLMLDDQSKQLFEMTGPLAECVRMLGGRTLRSIGHIARTQRLRDNDAEHVEPADMLAELRDDNRTLVSYLRSARALCSEHRDSASATRIEAWIDETERRTGFLFEATPP